MTGDGETYTKLPTEIEGGEDPIIQQYGVNLGMRQLVTLMLSGAFWFGLSKITAAALPISGLFAGVLWGWILIGGLALAFVKKEGVPLEEYLGWRIVYMTNHRRWIFKDRDQGDLAQAYEAEWEEDDSFQIPGGLHSP